MVIVVGYHQQVGKLSFGSGLVQRLVQQRVLYSKKIIINNASHTHWNRSERMHSVLPFHSDDSSDPIEKKHDVVP